MRPRLSIRIIAAALVTGTVVAVAAPAGAVGPAGGPAGMSKTRTLSETTRLADRRFVTTGDHFYEVGAEDATYPATGWHIRGEMGGFWTPPIKLLDGIWFAVDGAWLPSAERFTSGHGYVKQAVTARPGLTVERTDFVPGESRGALIGLRFAATGAEQTFDLAMQAHSELISTYPWARRPPAASRSASCRSTCPTPRPRATTATRCCSPTPAPRPACPPTTGRRPSARTYRRCASTGGASAPTSARRTVRSR
jgi:hypothetical protein